MGIFDKPDFEKMLARGDWPRVVHYANYTKNAELSALAMKAATRDFYKLVEYLYETAVWTQKNSSNRGRRLPGRGIRQINDASKLLVRVGAPSVKPLVESVRAYDQYGDPDEDARVLYFSIVFDFAAKARRTRRGRAKGARRGPRQASQRPGRGGAAEPRRPGSHQVDPPPRLSRR